tara:strand:- start:20011 stop:20193 length:183 start_codon:yes stop_codon:yes gene_type:complete
MSVDGHEEMLEQVWEEALDELPNGNEDEVLRLVAQKIRQRTEYGEYLYSIQKGECCEGGD